MPRGLRWCWWKVVEVPGTVVPVGFVKLLLILVEGNTSFDSC